ncbi:MAG: helix-turn-helix domain-containing protein [Coprococcus sp.]
MYEIYCKLRDSKGLKDSDIAKATGITKSTFSDWKNGRSKPKNAKLQKIADYFNVSLSYLSTGKEDTSETAEIKLTEKDERDIAKDMESIRAKLLNGADGPLSYDGEPIPEEDAELLLGQIELMMRRLKPINKEKYNPNKNKK